MPPKIPVIIPSFQLCYVRIVTLQKNKTTKGYNSETMEQYKAVKLFETIRKHGVFIVSLGIYNIKGELQLEYQNSKLQSQVK